MKKDVALVSFVMLFILTGLFVQFQSRQASEEQVATELRTDETNIAITEVNLHEAEKEKGILGARNEAPAKTENNDTTTESTSTEGGDDIMQYDSPPDMIIEPDIEYSAILKTNKGNITVELTPDETPTTVNNFVFLAKEGFYDGVIFHRVIEDFMIQGGDPLGLGVGGPGYTFEDEITDDQTFDEAGILAMANSGPNTNGSQFFITHDATPWLDGNHTIFGRVTDGMDVVDTIAQVETGAQDKPVDDVVIETIEIIEN